MKQITKFGCIYNLHPIHDLYASDDDGHIIDINEKKNIQVQKHEDYLYINVKSQGSEFAIPYSIQRFVWECFNSIVPKFSVIEHINNNERDNRLSNLQLVSKNIRKYYIIEYNVIENLFYKMTVDIKKNSQKQ